MNKKAILSLVTLAFLAGLAGCAPSSPQLGTTPDKQGPISLKAEKSKYAVNSKVDILVVVDDSLSMGKHQENLAANIDKFVDAFVKNGMIDFHIGVTTVYDSNHYGIDVKNFNPLGQLLPVKNPD